MDRFKFSKYVLYASLTAMLIGATVLSGIISFGIEDKLLLLRIAMILNTFAVGSNVVIVIVSGLSFDYVDEMQDMADNSYEVFNDSMERFRKAGLTVQKITKFEPLIDEVGEDVDEIDPESLSKAMKFVVKRINRFDGNGLDENLDEDIEDILEDD